MMADAGSPLALPWREALDTAIVHSSACPVQITGSRAVIGTTSGSDVVIDGHEAVLEIDGRTVTLRTADLLGAKVKAAGLEEGRLKTCVVLCYKPRAFPAGADETQALLPTSEILLYDPAAAKAAWPLARQELAVFQINTLLESTVGAGTVTIENDTHVDSSGRAVIVPGFSSADAESGESVLVAHSKGDQCTRLQDTSAVARPWQHTPKLPLYHSRLVIETEGDELVVKCKTGRPSWMSALVIVYILYRVLDAFLEARNDQQSNPDGGDKCERITIAVMAVCAVFLGLWLEVGYALRLLYRLPTLRVSPQGWSLNLCPESVLSNRVLRFILMIRGEVVSSSTVLGAKVMVNTYPPARPSSLGSVRSFWSNHTTPLNHSSTALLLTSEGAFPLDTLFGFLYRQNVGLLQQEHETLVAAINNHVATFSGSPPPLAAVNDVHASVFSRIAVWIRGRTAVSVPEHLELLSQQEHAVHTANCKGDDGRWVARDSVPSQSLSSNGTCGSGSFSTARMSIARSFPDSESGSTLVAQFLAVSWLWMSALYILMIPLALLMIVLVMLLLAAVILAAVTLGWFKRNACAIEIMTIIMMYAVIIAVSVLIDRTAARMHHVVSVECSGSSWKLRRALGWPPVRLDWKPRSTPLRDYVWLFSATVMEGSMHELLGCEVRIKRVKSWFSSKPFHRSRLVLHYQREGSNRAREISLGGSGWDEWWGRFDYYTSLSEKMQVAAAINSLPR